jgi:hypothetical protein
MTKELQTGVAQAGPRLTTVIPVRIKRAGGRKWMIPAAGNQPRTLSLIWLKHHDVPASCDDQVALLGRLDR